MTVNIQWFPGHMTKAIRMMEENLRLVDALIYVIDARAVYSCDNPLFNKLLQGKKFFTSSINAIWLTKTTLRFGVKNSSDRANLSLKR